MSSQLFSLYTFTYDRFPMADLLHPPFGGKLVSLWTDQGVWQMLVRVPVRK